MVVGGLEVRLGGRLSRAVLGVAIAAGVAACAGRSDKGDSDQNVGGGAGQSGTGGSSGTAGASASGGSGGSGASAGKGGSGGSGGSAGKAGGGGSAGASGSGGSAGKVDCAALSAASEAALNDAKRCDPDAPEPECTLRVSVGVVCGQDEFVNADAADSIAVMKRADAQYAMSCMTGGVLCGASAPALGANCSAAGVCETVYDNGGRGCRVDGTLYAHGAMHINPSFDCDDCTCDDGTLSCPEPAGCPECPEGTLRGEGCAICGPTDACLATEIGCFPTCETSADCPNKDSSICSNGTCVTGFCG
ncbi:MAG TPA: hypothetical protein VNN72_00905 [Polyangiaceae bacterium]|nr:hypothetical protein [Polyangiaceae bacterium]